MHNEPLAVTYQLGCAGIDWAALKETLLADDFDNGRTPEQLRLSCVNSAVNVFALLAGRVIGTVRVLSDGVGNAYMVDVWTLSTYRKRGIARRMIELALEQLPGQHVYLATDDAQEFYARLGFEPQDVGMSRIVGEYLVNASRVVTPVDTGQDGGSGAVSHRRTRWPRQHSKPPTVFAPMSAQRRWTTHCISASSLVPTCISSSKIFSIPAPSSCAAR